MRLPFALPLVLLFSLLPMSAPHAAVAVNATINGSAVNCSNANTIGYDLATKVFRFTCATDGITRTCTPTQSISYNLGAGTVSVTCNNGTQQGLVVDAKTTGGTQFGDGNGNVCTAATGFSFDLAQGGFTWTCGSAQSLSCTPTSPASYDLVNTKVTLTNCTNALSFFIYGDGFE